MHSRCANGLRLVYCGLALLVSLAYSPAVAGADISTPGVGVVLGTTFSSGESVNQSTGLDWGIFSDIPLAPMFGLSPGVMQYQVDVPVDGGEKERVASDIDISLKFMVPMEELTFFFGSIQGLTLLDLSEGDDLYLHWGIFTGGSYRVLPYLELYAMAQLKWTLDNDADLQRFHLSAGPVFRF